MKATLRNRITLRLSPFCFILLFSVIITSCAGQGKSNPSTTENSEMTEPYVDHLFFLEGQLCQHVREIFQDSKGHLWFGTNIYDMMRYDGNQLEFFTEKDGINGGRITGILEDEEGTVWFCEDGGIYKFDGEKFINFSLEKGTPANEIWSMTLDKNGLFWLGTSDGVKLFDGTNFSEFSMPKAQVKDTTTTYAYDRVTSIIEDRNGTMWFGTDGFGVCSYDGSDFHQFTTENGLPSNVTSELFEDSKGNIWIGTMLGGVSMYDGTSFTNFTQDGDIEGIEVGGFFEDKQGVIWFAAEHHGIYSYDGTDFTNHFKEKGLASNGILSMLEDKEGRFWLGGWGGLFRYDGNSFSSVTKDGPWN